MLHFFFFLTVRNLSEKLEELVQPTKGRLVVIHLIFELIMFIKLSCYLSTLILLYSHSVEIIKTDLLKELLSSEGMHGVFWLFQNITVIFMICR